METEHKYVFARRKGLSGPKDLGVATYYDGKLNGVSFWNPGFGRSNSWSAEMLEQERFARKDPLEISRGCEEAARSYVNQTLNAVEEEARELTGLPLALKLTEIHNIKNVVNNFKNGASPYYVFHLDKLRSNHFVLHDENYKPVRGIIVEPHRMEGLALRMLLASSTSMGEKGKIHDGSVTAVPLEARDAILESSPYVIKFEMDSQISIDKE